MAAKLIAVCRREMAALKSYVIESLLRPTLAKFVRDEAISASILQIETGRLLLQNVVSGYVACPPRTTTTILPPGHDTWRSSVFTSSLCLYTPHL